MMHRILAIFKRRSLPVSSIEKFKDFIQKDDSTYLDNSTIRFDVPDKMQKRAYVKIGAKGIISAHFIFESEKGEVIIGNNVHLGGVHFISRSRIVVHDDVTMAWGITIYDHNSHSIYWEERQHDNLQCYSDYIHHKGNNIVNKNWEVVVSKPITIESKVWIGFNVTILKGVTIGEGAVVGACSVVIKDVEPWTVVGGNPAQLIKRLK